MVRANMSYDDVADRTLPQIIAMIDRLSDDGESRTESEQEVLDRNPTVDELNTFCASFAGMNK